MVMLIALSGCDAPASPSTDASALDTGRLPATDTGQPVDAEPRRRDASRSSDAASVGVEDAGSAHDAARARDAGGGGGAGDGGPALDSGPSACERLEVAPGADATVALQAALDEASLSRVGRVPGEDADRTAQGRVYMGPGAYALATVFLPSNVRLEIDPGATISPLAGEDIVFQLGRIGRTPGMGTEVHNITITAGDGCGGRGIARSRAGPEVGSTNFRGNDPEVAQAWPSGAPTRGLTNAAIPWSSDWPVETMWVFDLDPRATGASFEVTGFQFVYATDVRVERVFSIQNAERYAADDPSTTGVNEANQLVPNVASRTTVMMFEPIPFSTDTARATARMPRRIHIGWHYNILSPPGQGPNQVRACIDCTFEHIFSHGGVALRVETDAIATSCPTNDCSCAGQPTTGPLGADGSLTGFREYATVDALSASFIEGVFGNRAVMFNPHCLTNGTAVVEHVRATGQGEAVIGEAPENGRPGEAALGGAGSFALVTVREIAAFGAEGAQFRTTMGSGGVPGGWRGYVLGRSAAAVRAIGTYPFDLGGAACWPATGPAALPDGDLSSVGGSYALTHSDCPTAFP